MEQTDIMQKFTIGIGSCNSATIGAPLVMLCATKLTTPKTVATYYVGNNLATETYPMFKHIEPPILLTQMHAGITIGFVAFWLNKYDTAPTRATQLANTMPWVMLTHCKNIPLAVKAIMSAHAKHIELMKILPGNFLR